MSISLRDILVVVFINYAEKEKVEQKQKAYKTNLEKNTWVPLNINVGIKVNHNSEDIVIVVLVVDKVIKSP